MQTELYFYVENLGLNPAQQSTLVDQLKTLGLKDLDANPRNRNHFRVRADGLAVIFEGWFEDSNLTAIDIRNRLASIFGVANASVTYTSNSSAYGPYVDYSYNSLPRVRVGIFAGPAASYAQSQAAALAFLAANAEAWNAAA